MDFWTLILLFKALKGGGGTSPHLNFIGEFRMGNWDAAWSTTAAGQ